MTNAVQGSGISGPDLDSIVEEAKQWYLETKQFLIDAMLSGGYPYGAVKLTPEEQYANYLKVVNDPAQLQALEASLYNLYKGRADAPFAVEEAMSRYHRLMQNLGATLGQTTPIGIPTNTLPQP